MPGPRARRVAGASLVAPAARTKKPRPQPAPNRAAATQPVAPPAQAVSAEVAAHERRRPAQEGAARPTQDSRLYAPAGDNAMEYYLALRDKSPGDPGVSSALTDLMPYDGDRHRAEHRDREDFVEAQRLYALDREGRPEGTVAAAPEADHRRRRRRPRSSAPKQQKLRPKKKRRARPAGEGAPGAAAAAAATGRAAARRAAAGAQQAEQDAAAKRDADQKAAAQREADQQAAQQRAAAAGRRPQSRRDKPAAAASSDLRPVSTPAPRYPPEALRAGTVRRSAGGVHRRHRWFGDQRARGRAPNPPRVFDREALAAVKRWRFEPVAAPVTTRRTIGFNPGRSGIATAERRPDAGRDPKPAPWMAGPDDACRVMRRHGWQQRIAETEARATPPQKKPG